MNTDVQKEQFLAAFRRGGRVFDTRELFALEVRDGHSSGADTQAVARLYEIPAGVVREDGSIENHFLKSSYFISFNEWEDALVLDVELPEELAESGFKVMARVRLGSLELSVPAGTLKPREKCWLRIALDELPPEVASEWAVRHWRPENLPFRLLLWGGV